MFINNRLLPKSGKIIPFDLFYSFLFKKKQMSRNIKRKRKRISIFYQIIILMCKKQQVNAKNTGIITVSCILQTPTLNKPLMKYILEKKKTKQKKQQPLNITFAVKFNKYRKTE